MQRASVWLLALLLFAWPNLARAQSFEDVVAQGLKFYEEGNFDAAIEKFFAAKMMRDEPDLIYNIARSYDKKADCAAASKYYEQFLARPDAATELRSKARKYLSDLGSCELTGTLTLSCYPENVLVTINEQPMGPCGSYKLEEGEYRLQLSAEGFKAQERTVTIVAARSGSVSVSLEYIEPGSIAAGDGSSSKLGAVILIAGGSALVLSSVVLDLVNYGVNAVELDKYALGDPRRVEFEDSYESYQVGMWVTGAVGVAALAGGILWYVLDSDEGSGARFGVAPALAQGGGGAVLSWQF
ncbi:MAG: PEGA domain-containing protein [Myxococcota bacterium]|jgi:tetratricopeptide (TPR) repeat protein|nr:PEGA domain-containing protein [Myxococcota bacterium]